MPTSAQVKSRRLNLVHTESRLRSSKVGKDKAFHKDQDLIESEFSRDLWSFFADKLYWISDAKPPQNIHNAFFFNIDNVSQYSPL